MRPSWDEYFLKIMQEVAARSTCNRGKPACVIVKNNQILATGYAGSPPGLAHCDEGGHMLEAHISLSSGTSSSDLNPHHQEILDLVKEERYSIHCMRTIHAEQNAINQAARYGVSIEGATAYITMTPCYRCAMSLISVGIKRVVCLKKYQSGTKSEIMFKKVGIALEFIEDGTMEYQK